MLRYVISPSVFKASNPDPFAMKRRNQFSLRKLLEGDWGSAITVCPKCGDTETHISKCLEDFVVFKHQGRLQGGVTTRL